MLGEGSGRFGSLSMFAMKLAKLLTVDGANRSAKYSSFGALRNF